MGILASYVTAIDALDFRSFSPSHQYLQEYMERELNKALVGFEGSDTPRSIATGNWGCGAFGGDPMLKACLQWMAATQAGKQMHYFPFDNKRVSIEFSHLTERLVKKGVTVGALAMFLYQKQPQGNLWNNLKKCLC
eukprot:NODE_6871_length_485_cov_33.112385_g6076_i0.p2 GENE.NODE_6871_length_485_cov_33.112385_g6076_i0~~NODE_6871_length_485_cov_33.112385_g6076_i0.p2  ORF type:complete len:144 (+),score=47.81 NODE_6871_length_485_cov_33.112385_g6076_i0:26-433(+)